MSNTNDVELILRDLSSSREFAFIPQRLVLAGFTGRYEALNQRHIDEMSALGIRISSSHPVFFELSPSLLQQSDVLTVPSHESSGEVEPVLFCTVDGWFIGIGSDHTARDLAREDVVDGKSACSKPVGREVVPVNQLATHWDEFELSSSVEGVTYQKAPLESMRSVSEIVDVYQKDHRSSMEGLVMFLGTIPLLGSEFSYGQDFVAELVGPGLSLKCQYDVVVSAKAP